jgi:hypothetical protein
MVYEIISYFTNKSTYFDAETNPNALAEAEAALSVYRSEALADPAVALYFTILRVVPVEGGEKWEPADLATDPGDGDYQVFDYHTGQYTRHDLLPDAVQAMEACKEQFLVENNLDKPIELPEMPPPRPKPPVDAN